MNLFNPFADQVRAFSDEELLAAYEATDGQPDNAAAATLLAETLAEERATDEKLTMIAESRINAAADKGIEADTHAA